MRCTKLVAVNGIECVRFSRFLPCEASLLVARQRITVTSLVERSRSTPSGPNTSRGSCNWISAESAGL